MSLNNQKCMIQPTFINLRPNEYSLELHYHPFTVKLGRSCDTINDLSKKICVPNKRFKSMGVQYDYWRK